MRASRLIAVVLFLGLIAAGCGFSPPSPPPTSWATCTQADGPSADTVAAEIAKLPAANWSEIVSGHIADCSLHWVVVSSGDASDSPGQVLFFDRKSPIGTPTRIPGPTSPSRPRPMTRGGAVPMASGPRAACCPTGIATVRFKIEDGKLKALDPIPNP